MRFFFLHKTGMESPESSVELLLNQDRFDTVARALIATLNPKCRAWLGIELQDSVESRKAKKAKKAQQTSLRIAISTLVFASLTSVVHFALELVGDVDCFHRLVAKIKAQGHILDP